MMITKQLKQFDEKKVKAALVEIVGHLWSEEEKDYRCVPEEEKPEHIFHQVDLVDRWLENQAALQQHNRKLGLWIGGTIAALLISCLVLQGLRP